MLAHGASSDGNYAEDLVVDLNTFENHGFGTLSSVGADMGLFFIRLGESVSCVREFSSLKKRRDKSQHDGSGGKPQECAVFACQLSC